MRAEASVDLLPAPSPAAKERVLTKSGWEVPAGRDPRVPFAALLVLYAVLGFTFLGFNRQWWQMALIVGSGAALDVALGWTFTKRKVLPLSAIISCTSLGILLNYSHHSWVLFFPVLLTIGGKYVLTFKGKHVFNPSMFGVATSLLVTRELITAAPAYQWAGGDVTMSLFLATAALMLFVFRGVGRGPLVVSFLFFYALQTAARAYIMRHHLPWQTLFLGTLESPPFYLFTFYMLTDPATSPKTPKGQVAFAFVLTLVDAFLHFKESVYTFFYAALVMATGKFLFLHARELWRLKGARLRQAWDADFFRRVGVVGALSLALVGGWAWAESPLAAPVDLNFRFERVPVADAGLGSTMGKTLEEVDPRVLHVAKWVLSVGDAVAAADVDDDGRVDVLLAHPLAAPQDRIGLFLNKGDFHFERVAVPGFDVIANDPTNHGLASGGVFADDDGDGDVDLILTVAFGKTRRFKNLLKETGALAFEDVSEASGLDEHTVSLGAAFFDFDNDGKLDLLVANALTTHLPDYAKPTPLNLFRLPQPEYDGDRRMFRFMHNGWHDADNGGKNFLYRGRGDGTYEKLDSDAMGLPETHWTLAIGTQDFNHDGWTDLYLASDFGHDDLYLNEGGRHFRRIEGPRFGDVGKDTYKGMNVSIADFDHDGNGDVYISNVHHALQSEGSILWMVRPSKDPFVPDFTDEATQRGALNERRFGWGAAAGDVDLDGWDDLVQANGMVDDRLDARELNTRRRDYWYVNQKLMQAGPEIHTYADRWGDIRGRHIYPNEPRRAYLNRGAESPGVFVDVAKQVGIDDPDNSRGVLLSDLDGDGDLDALITNQHGPASLYRNTRRDAGKAHFVAVALRGAAPTNLAALGSRVTVRSTSHGQPLVQVKELGSMGGFSATTDGRLVFGLGEDAPPEVEVTVAWHSGATQTLKLKVDQLHVLRP